jgi:hypothetical protein
MNAIVLEGHNSDAGLRRSRLRLLGRLFRRIERRIRILAEETDPLLRVDRKRRVARSNGAFNP